MAAAAVVISTLRVKIALRVLATITKLYKAMLLFLIFVLGYIDNILFFVQ